MNITENTGSVSYLRGLAAELRSSVSMWAARGDNQAELDRAIERVAECNARLAAAVAAATPRPVTFTGELATIGTETTHFVNSWTETFCGRMPNNWDDSPERTGRTGRATCRSCQRAGDSALRDPDYRVGSAARR